MGRLSEGHYWGFKTKQEQEVNLMIELQNFKLLVLFLNKHGLEVLWMESQFITFQTSGNGFKSTIPYSQF